MSAPDNIPKIAIDVVEPGQRARKGHSALLLGKDIVFSTIGLESYAFAKWQPVIYDAMVVAAAVEYGDKALRRPSSGWPRQISLRIPVSDPDRWNAPALMESLLDALEFLTGDYWSLQFVLQSQNPPVPPQANLSLPIDTQAILAYSDGMDSRAVAGIVGKSLGDRLVRVRVGSTGWDRAHNRDRFEPFARVPYKVNSDLRSKESSARSRGFRFSVISSIAAYLANANEIIIPESGQGALGPALIHVGHAYPDYRNHPLFTVRMEKFINALLGTRIRFKFPRLWRTKGETLREFVSLPDERDWMSTRSCWRGSRWSSMNGKRLQCGVCAACMLRRLSVHAAGLCESTGTYVCDDLNAHSFDEAIDKNFTRRSRILREYAIAGVLHMDHMAAMANEHAHPLIARHAALLAPALRLSGDETTKRLSSLIERHAKEWKDYMGSLGKHSFIRQWAQAE